MYFLPLFGVSQVWYMDRKILIFKIKDRCDIVAYTMEVIPQLNQYSCAKKVVLKCQKYVKYCLSLGGSDLLLPA